MGFTLCNLSKYDQYLTCAIKERKIAINFPRSFDYHQPKKKKTSIYLELDFPPEVRVLITTVGGSGNAGDPS